MELRQYRHVLDLADHASFRKGSEALGISQPALTKSLFQIEREVGQRLFDRHGQTISPTVFGAIVVDTARQMLDSQEAMTRAIGQTATLEAGELSVGVGPTPPTPGWGRSPAGCSSDIPGYASQSTSSRGRVSRTCFTAGVSTCSSRASSSSVAARSSASSSSRSSAGSGSVGPGIPSRGQRRRPVRPCANT